MSRARSAERSSRAEWLALRLAPLLAAAALGLLIGRSTAPAGRVRAAVPAQAGAARTRAGVPLGFPDTPAGAAQALAAYQRSFASPAILRAGVLKRRIEAVAMPSYAATMLAANSPGEQRIAAGTIGQGLARGMQTLYAAVPIGYRVESFSPRRTRVLTWGFTLLGNDSDTEPAAYFGIARTELRRFQGEWKIAETRAGFGPTPRLGSPPGPLGPYSVIALAKRLRSYELAP